MNPTSPKIITISQLLDYDGPTCLIIKAKFEPLGDQDRFQPAGFPEMGHVIYESPRVDGNGRPTVPEKVCIIDSAASMANHLETLCFANATTGLIHGELTGLPYVRCVTDRNLRPGNAPAEPVVEDPHDRVVVSTLTEGHRLASDYFLDAKIHGASITFRDTLRNEFDIIEIKKDQTYFVTTDNWWNIFKTIFKYDPNSLVHGVLFAKEQIKISRLLTASLEAFGAARVGSAGVKFDRLGKTTSGQPIFSKDEETAHRIEGTFLIDLGLLRSYGHAEHHGLDTAKKRLLLELALWKVQRMLATPFRFRSGCHLRCIAQSCTTEDKSQVIAIPDMGINIQAAIQACQFAGPVVTDVYYRASKLFTPRAEIQATPEANAEHAEQEEEEQED